MSTNFSDYIVYVDESGDHGLINIKTNYPIFVLVFCIFDKNQYLKTASQIQNMKFKYFGHDMVILHESDIRIGDGYFSNFSKENKANFLGSLTKIIKNQDFTVITAIIDKNKLKAQYVDSFNPYYLAMEFCLERLYLFLQEKQNTNKGIIYLLTHKKITFIEQKALKGRHIIARGEAPRIVVPHTKP